VTHAPGDIVVHRSAYGVGKQWLRRRPNEELDGEPLRSRAHVVHGNVMLVVSVDDLTGRLMVVIADGPSAGMTGWIHPAGQVLHARAIVQKATGGAKSATWAEVGPRMQA